MVARAQILSSALQTNSLPAFPAPSAIISQASPFWANGHGNLDRTSGQADPAGGTAAEQYLSNNGGTFVHSQYSLGGFTNAAPASGTYTSGTTVTASIIVKRVGTSGRYFRFNHYDGTTLGGDAGASFDLQTGAFVAYRSSGVTESGNGITDLGNGWFQLWYSFPIASTGNISTHEAGCASISASDGNFDAGGNTITVGEGFLRFRYQIVSGTNPNG